MLVLDKGKLVEVKPADFKNKLFRVENIPEGKSIEKLDLYEELNGCSYKMFYKVRVKIAKVRTDVKYIWFGWTKRKKQV